MNDKNNTFLSNECMKVIQSLAYKYPNDMDFSKNVRSFLQNTNSYDPSQLSLDLNRSEDTDE